MPESGESPPTQKQRSLGADAGTDTGRFHDVFLSYASPDAALAETIVAALERRGLRC
jgi:hypothetical protein